MGFLNNLFSTSHTFIVQTGNNSVSRGFENFVVEGYNKNPTVFACLELRSNSIASLNWVAYDKKLSDPKKTKKEESKIVSVLESPNEFLYASKYKFFKTLMLHLDIEGDAYIHFAKAEIGSMQKLALTILRPDRVEKLFDRQGILIGYKYKKSLGQEFDFLPDDVLHFSNEDLLNNSDGVSPLARLAESIGISNAGRLWNLNLLLNSASMPYIFKVNGSTDKGKFEAFKAAVKQRFFGASNAGKPGVFSGDVDVSAMGFSPKDMEWATSLSKSDAEIMRVFGVPAELLSDSSQRTYSNYQFARLSFFTETIFPIANMLRDGLNNKIKKKLSIENEFLDYEKSEVEALEFRVSQREELAARSYAGGLRTVTEARALCGLPKLDPNDYDELYQLPQGQNSLFDFTPQQAAKMQEIEKKNYLNLGSESL